MKEPSFDKLAGEWGTQTKEFLSILGEQVTRRLKQKLPFIIGGGVYGAFAVIFAVFVLTWLSVAAYQALLQNDFTPMVASLIVAGSCVLLSLTSMLILKLSFSRIHLKNSAESAEISEAGRELLSLSRDVVKSTLTPTALLRDQAGKIVAGSIIFGFLVGMAAEKPSPGAER